MINLEENSISFSEESSNMYEVHSNCFFRKTFFELIILLLAYLCMFARMQKGVHLY